MPAKKKQKKINLLPQEEFASSIKGRILKWFLSTFRAVVVLTEVVIMTAFFSRFWLDVKSADLSDKIDRQQAILNSLAPFEKEFKNYQKKLSIISSLSAKESGSKEVLSQITSILPQNIYLTNYSFTENEITIKGASSSERSIAQLIVNLENLDSFGEVALSSLSNSEEQPDLIFFGITITPKKGGK